jgi:hypothetical protein
MEHTNAQPELLELVDFKWLMAAEGRHVDLARLQCDARYADDCLACASRSPCEPLRRCARHLHDQLIPA